jgi:hypothetical protein
MPEPEDSPLVEGNYAMTDQWSIFLPQPFRRGTEGGTLVLSRPGIKAWIFVCRNDEGKSPEDRLSFAMWALSRNALNKTREQTGGLLRYAFRLPEAPDDPRAAAFCCFAFGAAGHVQMYVYFDSEDDLPLAEGLWRSLQERVAKL